MAVDNVARALAAKAIAGGGTGSSSGSGVQVQADCNIVDETNPAFIKNKPWEMGYQTVFTQDALDNYAQVAPDPTGKFVPGIDAQIQIDSVPIVKDKTYYVKCSSDQGIVEYTGKAIEIQDFGDIALGDADFSSDNPSTETISIAIVMNAEFGEAMIMILFNNLASANESDVPTLTNVSLTIQEVVVTKKISSDYVDTPKIEQVQADWNTADESDPSFIKNKPFGGDDPVVIFEKNSLDEYYFNWDSGAGYIPCISFNLGQNELTLVDGETYHVKCSSDQGTVEYTGKAKYVFDAVGGFILGDCISEDGSPDPNFNVAITVGETYDESNPPNISIQFRNLAVDTEDAVPTLTNVSIIIEKGYIKKIPSKFIDLSDIHISGQVQADWNDNDDASPSFIKNKPNIPTVYMVYKSKYENGDYLGKEMYEAIRNGSTIYYVDDTNATPHYGSSNITYYPMTSISIVQTCGLDFNIECTYTSWEYDTSSKTYVCTRNTLNMSFRKT